MANLKNNTKEFLSMLEGYIQRGRELHWAAATNSEHVLIDNINQQVLSYEDKVAETVMGCLDTRFGVGDLKTLLPNATSLADMLKEMKEDVLSFKEKVGDVSEHNGIQNVLDDFMTDINTWNYLRTFVH